ncbi:MAG: hypothetical protein Q7U52_11785 [Hydrogenophaga sp.]|nr:hypothetical protein [Hydrogenophaga sp.]
MPIQSDDIKLLKSAVMADVPEGGGAATGLVVVDGQSNNIFPDTSTDDRAAGRVNFRKVFGAAHTDDTDTLLGASFAVLAPPADPLVHVTLFETPGWADERATAREVVERYMVKGPRYTARVMDTHYTGSLLLQLYQAGGSDFPSAGDAIVLRNPNGAEQYVRIIKVTIASGTYNVLEGSTVTSFAANTAVCELAQALSMDVLGPPVARVVNEVSFAQVFRTTVAAGSAFYGVKPLAVPGAIGDRSVLAAGGIYTPLVPAATVETPLSDIAPLTTRASLSRTALAPLTLPAQTLTMQPGTVLRLPTAVQPASLTITRGATTFTDDGSGVLRQGTTAVGVVDYQGRSVTMGASAPSYGSASTVIAYRPATPAGAATHSTALTITLANQGLAFTAAFEPPPAPGTFTLSYMAQGRWYDLVDNGNGKLAGADSSYGAGTINYATGSIAYTLGAIPDVGSAIIYGWGDAASASAVDASVRPAALQGQLVLDARLRPETLVLSWTEAGVSKSATCNAAGVLAGNATGTCVGGVVTFTLAAVPSTPVTATYTRAAEEVSGTGGFVNNGMGSYTATQPVVPGTLRVTVLPVPSALIDLPVAIIGYDDGAGVILSSTPGITGALGTVDYATGSITISSTVAAVLSFRGLVANGNVGGGVYARSYWPAATNITVQLLNTTAVVNGYAAGAGSAGTETQTPTWGLFVPLGGSLPLSISGLAFTHGGVIYTANAGQLRAGWDAVTGEAPVVGSVSSNGTVSLLSAPAAGAAAQVSWINLAQDRSASEVVQGVFRVQSAPLKVGVLQIQAGALVGSANEAGVISGNGWAGTVDYARGIVRWNRLAGTTPATVEAYYALGPVPAAELTYNAVFLQYVPIDGTLLGLETARLPLDGRVPIYRPGGQVIVHNTLTTTLPNPLTKGTAYSLGRERVAAVLVRTAAGVKVPGALYDVDFSAGTITFPVASDLTGLDQPFTVHHRVEDELLVLRADISGKLDLVAALTHSYPAGSSYVSSKLRKGDLFARAFLYIEQTTWTSVWSDVLIGGAPTATYNNIDFPIAVTNRGAITEQWAVIFTGATQVRVVGRSVGQVLTNVSINAAIEAINPQTGAPYFSIPALGWGGGWAVGNVLRFNTAAAGGPAWVARTVLPGPATVASDAATVAFRADVDA